MASASLLNVLLITLNYIKRIKRENHIVMSIYSQNTFGKIQYLIAQTPEKVVRKCRLA